MGPSEDSQRSGGGGFDLELRSINATNTTLSLEAGTLLFSLLTQTLTDQFPGGNNKAGPVNVLVSKSAGPPGWTTVTIAMTNDGPNATGFPSIFDPAGSSFSVKFTGMDSVDAFGSPGKSPMVLLDASITYQVRAQNGAGLIIGPTDVITNFTGVGTPSLNFLYANRTSPNSTISNITLKFNLQNVAPEPGTIVLLGLGALAFVRRRRR